MGECGCNHTDPVRLDAEDLEIEFQVGVPVDRYRELMDMEAAYNELVELIEQEEVSLPVEGLDEILAEFNNRLFAVELEIRKSHAIQTDPGPFEPVEDGWCNEAPREEPCPMPEDPFGPECEEDLMPEIEMKSAFEVASELTPEDLQDLVGAAAEFNPFPAREFKGEESEPEMFVRGWDPGDVPGPSYAGQVGHAQCHVDSARNQIDEMNLILQNVHLQNSFCAAVEMLREIMMAGNFTHLPFDVLQEMNKDYEDLNKTRQAVKSGKLGVYLTSMGSLGGR